MLKSAGFPKQYVTLILQEYKEYGRHMFSLEQATKAQRVSRGIVLLFHDLGA